MKIIWQFQVIELLDIKIKDTIQGPADKLIQPKQVEIKQQKPQRTGYQKGSAEVRQT